MLVDRSGAQDAPEVLRRELLPRVDEVEVARARGERLLLQARGLLGLADVDGDRHDLAAVVLLEPGDDDRRVEASRVGEGGLPDLRRAHAAPSFSVSSRAVTKAESAAFGMT